MIYAVYIMYIYVNIYVECNMWNILVGKVLSNYHSQLNTRYLKNKVKLCNINWGIIKDKLDKCGDTDRDFFFKRRICKYKLFETLIFPPKDSNNIRKRFCIWNIDKFCCLMTYLANCEAVVFHNKTDINRLLNVLQDITILICVL